MNGIFTQGIGSNGLPMSNTGIPMADFLLGYYSSVNVAVIPPYGLRQSLYSGYIQDDWRVTPNLTHWASHWFDQ
jgi:hypothetical protein